MHLKLTEKKNVLKKGYRYGTQELHIHDTVHIAGRLLVRYGNYNGTDNETEKNFPHSLRKEIMQIVTYPQ
jgi:hypothetical protein